MLERLLRPLLTWRRLDLRAARRRLDALAARHLELSAIASLDDDPAGPNRRLLDLALAAIQRARDVELATLAARGAPALTFTWPGEHYRLLAALVDVLRPRSVVEIGTFQGASALAMLDYLPAGATLTTFDLVPWDEIAGTLLCPADFADGRLVAVTADLGRRRQAARHAELLRRADLVFVDAAKDGSLEERLLANLEGARAATPDGGGPGPLLVLDDIRVWNMLHVWRAIRRPKLDLTSFGHWSGTGLVDLGAPRSAGRTGGAE